MDSTTSRSSRPDETRQGEIVFPAGTERERNEVHRRVTDPNLSAPAEPFTALNAVAPEEAAPSDDAATPLWVQRVSLIVYVVFCIELGMLLAVLPWTHVWNDNGLLVNSPGLRAFLHQNFVRGAVTGLGLVDVWLGIWEAVHYREKK